MSPRSIVGKSTQQRVLDSACEVFAEKGFRNATIQEICERADANVASVNYYFRSKENLYVEAWRHAFQRSVQKHPPDGGAGDDAPIEVQLRARILALLRRITDDECTEFEVVRTELANPTGLLHEVVSNTIQPLKEKMLSLVRALLGEAGSDEHVELCAHSVISQCFDVVTRRRLLRDTPAGRWMEPDRIEALADHITQFSLAGIRDLRQRITEE